MIERRDGTVIAEVAECKAAVVEHGEGAVMLAHRSDDLLDAANLAEALRIVR